MTNRAAALSLLLLLSASVWATDYSFTGEELGTVLEKAGKIQGYLPLPPEPFEHFFFSYNPDADPEMVRRFVLVYLEESSTEDINPLIAFAQMCHETDFLRFTGQVKSSQHNYAGIGVTNGTTRGLSFPDMRTGIRAHIQHLLAYTSDREPYLPLVDPRFHLVRERNADTAEDLTGRWATNPNYHKHLMQYIYEIVLIHIFHAGTISREGSDF